MDHAELRARLGLGEVHDFNSSGVPQCLGASGRASWMQQQPASQTPALGCPEHQLTGLAHLGLYL